MEFVFKTPKLSFYLLCWLLTHIPNVRCWRLQPDPIDPDGEDDVDEGGDGVAGGEGGGNAVGKKESQSPERDLRFNVTHQ